MHPDGNFSVYVPKHERNFIKICRAYHKEVNDGSNFSIFVLRCIKNFVITLSKEQQKVFNSCHEKLSIEERPEAREFVDKFMEGK